jgi:hypothetical protein
MISAIVLLAACGHDSGPAPRRSGQARHRRVARPECRFDLGRDRGRYDCGRAVPTGATPAERSPQQAIDMATVHLAMYDAAMAVAGTHKPYAVTPSVSGRGMGPTALQAAIIEAAYRTLKGLYPSRGDKYEAAYAQAVGALPESAEKIAGVAIGREVATGILALRANDGRETALQPYVPGHSAGQFRGTNPVNRIAPYIRPS